MNEPATPAPRAPPPYRPAPPAREGYTSTIVDPGSLQAFLDAAPVIAWMKNDGGDYVFQNAACERYFGTDPNDWFGVGEEQLHPNAEGHTASEYDRAVTRSQQPLHTRETRTAADGSQAEFLVLRFPFIDAHGRHCVGGIAVNLSDSPESSPA
ncbi:MAG: PAS domain-containing protein [Pseudomonadota bacterium]|nr:PAS domain-containing protein [Pseudomonadota bacterium]